MNMNFINSENLEAYIFEVADRLDWRIGDHASIYKDISEQGNINLALDIIDEKVKPWFIRNGKMNISWRSIIGTAINGLTSLDYTLPDIADEKKLVTVAELLKPLGHIKQVVSGSENYLAPSKILNFFFPGLIPKIDGAWIKGVCLRKINTILGWNRFRLSGFTDLQQFKDYLRFGAEQDYNDQVLKLLEKHIGVRHAYAVAFEYCLLGFCKNEVLIEMGE